MRLDISKIKGGLYSQVNVDFDLEINDAIDPDVDFTTPIHVNAVISNMENGYDIDGSMDVFLDTICCRCLKPFHYHSVIEFHDNLKNYEDESGDKVFYSNGNQAYLDGLIRTNLLLSLPLRYLCDDNCKGINYNGKDSNVKSDADDGGSINPKFEILKKFKKQ